MKTLSLFPLIVLAFCLFACGEDPHRSRPPLGTASQGLSTARAIESTVQTIGDIGGGQYEWTVRVNFVGLGGTCDIYVQADVAVVNNSAVALPSAATRCGAYKDYVDNELACAANTIGLLGCDVLAYSPTTPL